MEMKIAYKKGGVKLKKKATYVITLSKVFPGTHPKKGEPTYFREKLLKKLKLHTIRGNYDLWSKRIDKINKGQAILSVRQWEGKPYNSKCGSKQEIARFEKVGYQKINIRHFDHPLAKMTNTEVGEEKKSIRIHKLSENDGFNDQKDFIDWFPKELIGGIIIHFTDFRY